MAEILPQRLKDAIRFLLQIPGGAASTPVRLEDGGGNQLALAVGQDGAKVYGDLEVTGSLVGQLQLSDDAPQPLGAASSGDGLSGSRSNHVHAHGDQGGGTQHTIANTEVAGFMSGAMVQKLASVTFGADVTDATKVAAAGAVMDGDFSTNGLMERTGAGVYAVRALGVGASTSVLTRGDGDSRYLPTSGIDAASVITGVLDIARIPAAALERMVAVPDQAARYALTTASVQLGDTVKQVDTGILYLVVDTANLGNSAGYQVYVAGSAASVPWSGVTSKPTTLSGYGITDAAPLASPAMTGTPTAPTAATATNTMQVATTAFAQALVVSLRSSTTPAALAASAAVGSGTTFALADHAHQRQLESIIVAASDLTTAITAGATKESFRMPYAFTATSVKACLATAQSSGSIFTVNVKKNGATIFSTKITIDNTETSTATAATPPVLSTTAFADDDLITVDVDQIGDGTAKGLKVTLIGRQSA